MAEISFCGQICAECPVYQVTRENDLGQRIWLALEYSSESHQYHPAEMHCQGCHSLFANLAPMCKSCEIRNCALGRVLVSCAECVDYPCDIIERLVPVDTDNRAELEYRHDTLITHRCRSAEIFFS